MTDAEIELLAQSIYFTKATAEQKQHRQYIAAWVELGESFKVSLRTIARDILSKENPA